MDMQNMPSGSVYASGTQGAAVGASRISNGSTSNAVPSTGALKSITVRVPKAGIASASHQAKGKRA
jgi:hypothetical protein